MVSLPKFFTDLKPEFQALPPEAEELLHDGAFAAALEQAAADAGRSREEVSKEAVGYLREMAASQSDALGRRWRQFGDWFLRAYDVWVDEDQIAALKDLDRRYSLGLAFSHRSYLDGFVVPNVLSSRRFSPTYTFGGANLDLPGIGSIASRTGVIFIRRKSTDIPVYRLTLRHYISHMVRSKRNMAWSIEGGRTRTGKLRPPVHGILKYLTDAVESKGSPDVMVVPISIVYDQLHELEKMTKEARGDQKTPENFR
ncbi:MAG TPA: 1-acyl-sn-glycerol-3-phosphate acyltransferase, partial [Marmoricola sp.]|nr:1-acyl-sn-glycerol-3-phosphate acyltransferase [Marmoricola sp.]